MTSKLFVHEFLSECSCEAGPLSEKTLSDKLAEIVRKQPDAIAVISQHEDIVKTYREFGEEVTLLANALRNKLDLKLGDHISIWSADCYLCVLALHAAARAGLCLWYHNPNYKAFELEYELRLVEPKVLLLPSSTSLQQNLINDFQAVLKDVTLDIYPRLVLMDGSALECDVAKYRSPEVFTDLLTNCSREDLEFTTFPTKDSELVGLFTSGSTGRPKGLVVKHAELCNTEETLERMDHSKGRIHCLPVPFFHGFVHLFSMSGLTGPGITFVIPYYKYSFSRMVEAMVKFECTNLAIVPVMLIDFCDHIEKTNAQFPKLSGLMAAGAAVPPDVFRRIARLVPSLTSVQAYYGASEVSLVTMPFPGIALNLDNSGVALPGVKMKVVDQKTRKTLPIGEAGLLLVRTPHFRYYFKNRKLTESLLDKDGWFDTGDIIKIDKTGRLYFVGRTKDIVSRGGVNISTVEVENVLIGYSSVKNVTVVPISDRRLGEEMCAWVKLKEGHSVETEQLRSYLSTQLSKEKVPKYFFISDFTPLTGSGKVSKRLIQDAALKKLNCK